MEQVLNAINKSQRGNFRKKKKKNSDNGAGEKDGPEQGHKITSSAKPLMRKKKAMPFYVW